jgi:hypothetical protein
MSLYMHTNEDAQSNWVAVYWFLVGLKLVYRRAENENWTSACSTTREPESVCEELVVTRP